MKQIEKKTNKSQVSIVFDKFLNNIEKIENERDLIKNNLKNNDVKDVVQKIMKLIKK